MVAKIHCKIELAGDGPKIVARELKDPSFVKDGPDGNPVWRPFIPTAPPPVPDERTHRLQRDERIDPDMVVEAWTLEAIPLAEVKASALQVVDVELEMRGQQLMASDVRSCKGMIFSGRDREARELEAAPLDEADYPFLGALVGTSYGADLLAVAARVRVEHDAMARALAALDSVAVAAKDAISAAGDGPAAVAALDAVVWP